MRPHRKFASIYLPVRYQLALVIIFGFQGLGVIPLTEYGCYGETLIDLSGRNLSYIPDDVWSHCPVNLNISDNRLVDLTPISRCTELETLNAAINSVSTFPYCDGCSLRKVNLSYNPLCDLKNIEACVSIEILKISNTYIQSIDGLRSLDKLRYLDVSATRIDSISISLPILKYINISDCAIAGRIDLCESLSLETFKAMSCGISDLSFIRCLTNLRTISVSDNYIRNIDSLSNCDCLERIYLAHNKIDSITPLKAIDSIMEIDISHNQLDDISILVQMDLHQLEYLDLSNNPIKDLRPLLKAIRSIPNLKRMGLVGLSHIAGFEQLISELASRKVDILLQEPQY